MTEDLIPALWQIAVPFLVAAILIVFYALWRFSPGVEVRPQQECQDGDE